MDVNQVWVCCFNVLHPRDGIRRMVNDL